jgi:hypothetical protein
VGAPGDDTSDSHVDGSAEHHTEYIEERGSEAYNCCPSTMHLAYPSESDVLDSPLQEQLKNGTDAVPRLKGPHRALPILASATVDRHSTANDVTLEPRLEPNRASLHGAIKVNLLITPRDSYPIDWCCLYKQYSFHR